MLAQRALLIAASFGLFGLFDFSRAAGQIGEHDIDIPTKNLILPYVYMAQDAYSNKGSATIPDGWTRVEAGWITKFNQAAASSGFFAAVYGNDKGDIAIGYRGTVSSVDLKADVQAQTGTIPDQYKYAVQFAEQVKQQYPLRRSLSTTGHSSGGGKAAYVAQQTPGIANVVTVDSARPPIVSGATAGSTSQINLVTRGERIGDAKSDQGAVLGMGQLSGKTVYFQPTLSDALRIRSLETAVGAVVTGVPGTVAGKIAADFMGAHKVQVAVNALTAMMDPGDQRAPTGARQNSGNAQDPFGAVAGITPARVQPNFVSKPLSTGPSQSASIIPSQAGQAPRMQTGPGGISLSRAAAD
ncbi:Mbeg1-like protein [Bradyrhizobium sp. USDA 329]|uniref:Mbeg1-like protein n=1 Tax=unclassified Bradyrhizobium TaxID=2631580 RepID=UPI003511FEBE